MTAELNELQQACTGPEAQLVPGRLQGFRWFNFTSESPLGIGSIMSNGSGRIVPWQREMTAKCYNRNRMRWYPSRTCQAPNTARGHECGIYGYHTPLHSTSVFGLRPTNAAFGVIEASGRILLGDIGFRAEKARLVAVACLPNTKAESACRQAGIIVYEKVRDMLGDWPSQDISSLVAVRSLQEYQRRRAYARLLHCDVGILLRESYELAVKHATKSARDLEKVVRNGERFRGELGYCEDSLRYNQEHLESMRNLVEGN